MLVKSILKHSILAGFLAYGGVVWLTLWHQFGYGTLVEFPPISSQPRDAAISLVPVILAVWLSSYLSRRLILQSRRPLPPWLQRVASAALLAVLAAAAMVLVEANRTLLTGIGNEVAIQVNLCRALSPDSNLFLKLLLGIFPNPLALRTHVLLQDGLNLAPVNMGIAVFLMILLESLPRSRPPISSM